jgi:bla regulator protein blaR1
MNGIAAFSSGPVFHSIAVALVASLWQGAVVAVGLAAVRSLLSRSRARARYAAGCLALALMLVLPASSFWAAAGQPAPGTPRVTARPSAPLASPRLVVSAPFAPALGIKAFGRAESAAEPWLVLFWLAGVSLLSLRLAMGWAAIEQLRHRWTTPAPAAVAGSLREIARRLRISRPVRVLTSAAIRVPTALGLFRPIILMPLASLSGFSAQEIEAMLAHELAHIRRHDYLVNLLQSLAETLLFYHPAVWWIGRAIRAERENCCDDLAVAATGSARRYARALLHLEEVRSAPLQFALAATGGSLSRRILRLLGEREDHFRGSKAGACVIGAAALVILVGAGRKFAVPVASVGEPSELISLSALSRPSPPAVDRPAAAEAPALPAPSKARSRIPEPLETVQAAPDADVEDPPAAAAAEPTDSPVKDVAPAPEATPAAAPLPQERLEELRRYGVTPEFLRGFVELGYDRISPSLLVTLRTHGVDAAYVRELNDLFSKRLTLETCVALRIHGVGPSSVREMHELLGKISPEENLSLRVHGVTADELRRFRDAGYPRLSTNQAIMLRSHGVDPAMAGELASLGFPRPSLDELRAARDHGVDTEFLRGMSEGGFADRSLDRMIALRNHGVTPDYVRSFKELGYGSLSVDQALALRNHGVSPEFVKDFQGLGYKGLSVDELLSLRNHGVDADFARNLQGLGYKSLPLEDLLSLRSHGVTVEFVRKASSRGRLSVDDLIERKNSGRE